MGVSLITALTIQSRNVICDAGGPDSSGKYSGWIMLETDSWHPLLSTPNMYDTAEQAKAEMEKTVAGIRATKLENPLDTMPEGPIIKQVVATAQAMKEKQ